jgi:vacuolar-type H+-ATPase subunit I/STV1
MPKGMGDEFRVKYCLECRRVWERNSLDTKVAGSYTYHEDFPTIALPREQCKECKERQDNIFKTIHLKVSLADRRNIRGSRTCFIRLGYERFESLKKHIKKQIDEKSFRMKNGDLVEIIKVEEYDDEKVKSVENTLEQYLINKRKVG